MTISSITITALAATPTLRGNKLVAAVSATGPAANIPTLMLANVEFFAATANDFTTATKVGEGNPEFLHAGLIEEQTYYYWAKPRAVNGSYGAVYPASPTGGVACTAIGMAGLLFGLANGKIVASVAASALTIAIKTAAGNDPSSGDSVFVAFRNAALATGNYQTRQIAATLSLVISSGSTLSTANSTPFRIWLVLFDDAGTLQLAAINCSNGFGVTPLVESALASTTAEGGAGGADSLSTFYASSAITSKPFRVIGYLEWTSGLATAGAWSAAPDIIQMRGFATKLPGDIVQTATNYVGGYTSFVADIPFDNTAPVAASEGGSFFNVDVTPTSPANLLLHTYEAALARSTAGPLIIALCKLSTTNALATETQDAGADKPVKLSGRYIASAGDTTPQRYFINMGATGGATVYRNGNSGGGLFNSTMRAFQSVTEIMG